MSIAVTTASFEPARKLAPSVDPPSGTTSGRVVILIPAYDPEPAMVEFVRRLSDQGVDGIVVVDDGSRAECGETFHAIQAIPDVTLLRHAVNLGKGAALKTGFNHLLLNESDLLGVVTADADGQHLPADVLRLVHRLRQNPKSICLGARQFAGNVPLRSRIGNVLTRYVFWFFAGLRLQDTQTGLRAIPRALMGELLRIPATGYEFEMEMLIRTGRRSARIVEVPIQTVYLDGNRSSHFNPLLDSMRIYFVFLRFTFSSLVTTTADYLVFSLAYALGGSVLMSLICARAVAVVINYALVSRVVFHGPGISRSFARFLAWTVILGLIAWQSISLLHEGLGLPVLAAKLIAESALYLANFLIQRTLIFPTRTAAPTY